MIKAYTPGQQGCRFMIVDASNTVTIHHRCSNVQVQYEYACQLPEGRYLLSRLTVFDH